MMKFHAFARKKADGTMECHYPKKEDVIQFAKDKKAEIDSHREPVAIEQPAPGAPASGDSQLPAAPDPGAPSFNVNGTLEN